MFSHGWQGCSEGYPRDGRQGRSKGYPEGRARGKSWEAALLARGEPRPSKLFFLSDLHSFSKRILQLSKIETVYKEETIFCKAYWGHIRCKIANSATTFFPNFSVRFLMCFLLLLCWRSPVHSRKTALTDCNMSWRLPSVVSQHLALADFMYDFLNIHIF